VTEVKEGKEDSALAHTFRILSVMRMITLSIRRILGHLSGCYALPKYSDCGAK
jgi:hypothetical protein